jgi:alpha-tubulin suppressor-like RCC1 family protein
LFTWGSNKDGRLGHENEHSTATYEIPNLKFSDVALGSHHTVGITENGEVYGWGRNSHTQASLALQEESVKIPIQIHMDKKVAAVAAGWGHTLLLDTEGNIYSWGYNQEGQLGQGNKEFYNKPTKIPITEHITKIYAGHSHSAFIDSN